jgi:hypothetical protein
MNIGRNGCNRRHPHELDQTVRSISHRPTRISGSVARIVAHLPRPQPVVLLVALDCFGPSPIARQVDANNFPDAMVVTVGLNGKSIYRLA